MAAGIGADNSAAASTPDGRTESASYFEFLLPASQGGPIEKSHCAMFCEIDVTDLNSQCEKSYGVDVTGYYPTLGWPPRRSSRNMLCSTGRAIAIPLHVLPRLLCLPVSLCRVARPVHISKARLPPNVHGLVNDGRWKDREEEILG